MSNSPLYMTIYDSILLAIQNGEYAENSPLPTERNLAEKYHVSRSTIRQALETLKEHNYIYTIHGNGTFVKPQVFEQSLFKFYSFTDELKNSNNLIHNEVIDYELITLDRDLAIKLGYSTNDRFHKLIRLRSVKDYPLMIETTYLPQNRFFKLNIELLKTGSLYTFLKEKYSLQVDRATETFKPIIPNVKDRALLNITASIPCTLLERYSYEENVMVEYTASVVRGDKYSFKVELRNDLLYE
ncbi:GntR family transcriptional regulator [Mobilisporobacter senegalensis]|uniref:GntR family transcriptional regulator n=1 Tax=Mobilisporobacter senegalensis TaxID=1329262 RepID=A0A3N1X5V5_9FIRM|nr:GntR family transcriptional regulator [Mobilisporobacter senegalensis]ROR22169.1 GntR family transcriptional regulator [Mobilisporobacter senegalensis]